MMVSGGVRRRGGRIERQVFNKVISLPISQHSLIFSLERVRKVGHGGGGGEPFCLHLIAAGVGVGFM